MLTNLCKQPFFPVTPRLPAGIVWPASATVGKRMLLIGGAHGSGYTKSKKIYKAPFASDNSGSWAEHWQSLTKEETKATAFPVSPFRIASNGT